MKLLFKKTLQLVFVCLSFYAETAIAIVNIENMRVDSESKTQGFESMLALDISGKNGNTQKVKAGLGARGQWYKEKGTQFIVLNYEYGESSEIKDTDKTFLHYRNIRYQNKELAWEVFSQIENNKFTRLSLRGLLGAGIRWQILKNSEQISYLGLGAFRSKEKLEEQAPATDYGVTYNNRINLYLVYKYTISDNSRFVNTLYYQPDISDTKDYRLLEQFGLQVDINGNLSFKVSLDMAHDNRPPQLINKTDTSYNTGFEYRF